MEGAVKKPLHDRLEKAQREALLDTSWLCLPVWRHAKGATHAAVVRTLRVSLPVKEKERKVTTS